jgi:parvulin-like peptidyl-prolyl isomerase
MKKKAVVILSMILAVVFTLTGCSGNSLKASETIATLDDTTNVTLGEFSLLLRYEQAQMETYYGSMFGSNIYQQDLYGTGTVYGETAKENLVTEFERMYILEAEAPNYGVELTDDEKAAITEAAQKFMEANDKETRKAVAATQEGVEHLLTLLTLNDKMYDALTADVDTEVSDEEAAQKRISYVYVSILGTEQDEDGNTIDLTDEEKEEKKAQLQAVLDAAKESGDLSAAAEEQELTASSVTYGADSTSPADEVRAAADELEDGEFAELIETENGYYAVQMESTFDEDATATKKESILSERRETLFEEKYAELQEAHSFETVEDVLAKLTFDRNYTLKTEE